MYGPGVVYYKQATPVTLPNAPARASSRLLKNGFGVRRQAQRDAAWDSMSDKLQFVDPSIESGFAGNDKLKFIGHNAPSPLRSAGETPKFAVLISPC